MLRRIATLVLSLSSSIASGQGVGGAEYFAGGPFTITGEQVVACASPDAAEIVNVPDAGHTYGRASVAQAMTFGRCEDYPPGLPVLVRGIYARVAMVVPDVRGLTAARFVPLEHVVNILGDPVNTIPEVKWPRITYQAASHLRH